MSNLLLQLITPEASVICETYLVEIFDVQLNKWIDYNKDSKYKTLNQAQDCIKDIINKHPSTDKFRINNVKCTELTILEINGNQSS